jgi:hypothetical protein
VGTHQPTKEKLKKEYTRWLRMILKSKLNAKNKNYSYWSTSHPNIKIQFLYH